MDINTIYHKNMVDLTGRVFQRLTVMHRDVTIGLKIVRWICSCECGTIKSIAAAKLVHGNTVSCGCKRAEKRVEFNLSRHDFEGRRFGRLLVNERVFVNGSMRWNCSCDCGKTKNATTLYLKVSGMASCGCAMNEAAAARRFVDLTGRIFGKLTAVRHVGFTVASKATWLCSCSCGSEKTVIGALLTCGRTISCGCARKDASVYMTQAARDESAVKCALRRARKLAAGGKFTVAQIDDLHTKQRGRCACCGDSLGLSYHRDHKIALTDGGSNGIENIELLCGGCNLRKGSKDPITWANENGRLC